MLYFPGGKGANQAVSAAKLGAPTTLIGRLGKDAFGRELRAFLAAQGIDLSFVRESDAHTGTAIITLANADNTIVVIPGANGLVTPEDVSAATLTKGDIAVSQFEIPLPTIVAFFKRARAAGATTILNPAPAIAFGTELLDLVDILDPQRNRTRPARQNRNSRRRRSPHASSTRRRSLHGDGKRIICVTLGKRGVLALVDGKPLMIEGRPVKAIDTTGAGDCFVGAVAAQLAAKKSISDALNYANRAASICVQRMGAAPSMPTAAEVEKS